MSTNTDIEKTLTEIIRLILADKNPLSRFHSLGHLQNLLDEIEKGIAGERGQCIRELRESSTPRSDLRSVGQILGVSSSRAHQLAHTPRRDEWKSQDSSPTSKDSPSSESSQS